MFNSVAALKTRVCPNFLENQFIQLARAEPAPPAELLEKHASNPVVLFQEQVVHGGQAGL
jgi:hypothetical protein